jgi:hypothetical protein
MNDKKCLPASTSDRREALFLRPQASKRAPKQTFAPKSESDNSTPSNSLGMKGAAFCPGRCEIAKKTACFEVTRRAQMGRKFPVRHLTSGRVFALNILHLLLNFLHRNFATEDGGDLEHHD